VFFTEWLSNLMRLRSLRHSVYINGPSMSDCQVCTDDSFAYKSCSDRDESYVLDWHGYSNSPCQQIYTHIQKQPVSHNSGYIHTGMLASLMLSETVHWKFTRVAPLFTNQLWSLAVPFYNRCTDKHMYPQQYD